MMRTQFTGASALGYYIQEAPAVQFPIGTFPAWSITSNSTGPLRASSLKAKPLLQVRRGCWDRNHRRGFFLGHEIDNEAVIPGQPGHIDNRTIQ